MRRFSTPLLAALAVTACGGGGNGPPPPPPPVNQAPVITSAAAASVPENSATAFYQATASDPDGNVVSYRIEGADAARFSISATGAISFVAPPNFEAPTDADSNNVYQIVLVASDGTAESKLNLAITVTNVAEQVGLRQLDAENRFVSPMPGSSRSSSGAERGRSSPWTPPLPVRPRPISPSPTSSRRRTRANMESSTSLPHPTSRRAASSTSCSPTPMETSSFGATAGSPPAQGIPRARTRSSGSREGRL